MGNQGRESAGQFTWQCQCGQRYRSTMDDIGKTAQCRKCGARIVVPRPPTPQKNPSSPTHASAKPPAHPIEKREETPAGEPTSSPIADDAAKAAPPAKKDDYTILGLFLLVLLAVNSAIVSIGGGRLSDDIAIAVLPVILFAVLAHRILLKGMRGLPEGIEQEGKLRKLHKWFLPAFWAYAFVGAVIVYFVRPSLMWGAVMFGLPTVAFEVYILSQAKSPRLYLVPMIAVGSAGAVMILACYVSGYGWLLPLVLCLVGTGILYMPFGKWGSVSKESGHTTWVRRAFPSRNDWLLVGGCLLLGLVGVALDWFGVMSDAFLLLPVALTVVIFHAIKPLKPLQGTNAKVSYVVLVVVAALWISHEGYWRVRYLACRNSNASTAGQHAGEGDGEDAAALVESLNSDFKKVMARWGVEGVTSISEQDLEYIDDNYRSKLGGPSVIVFGTPSVVEYRLVEQIEDVPSSLRRVCATANTQFWRIQWREVVYEGEGRIAKAWRQSLDSSLKLRGIRREECSHTGLTVDFSNVAYEKHGVVIQPGWDWAQNEIWGIDTSGASPALAKFADGHSIELSLHVFESIRLADAFFEDQKAGGNDGSLWGAGGYYQARFFSLRDWTLLTKSVSDGDDNLLFRVDSSTNSGIPITKTWKITFRHVADAYKFGGIKIRKIEEY